MPWSAPCWPAGGAAYQGVFRNPLADPYLLGVAAGGGLGATMIIITGGSQALLPPAAFIGAGLAVAVTYLLGATGRDRSGIGGATASIVLAGVAVAALFTAVQTYLQQEHTQVMQQIYAWILGSLATASWSDVAIILPYAVVAAALLLAHRRLLDVLRVGEVEATSLGVDIARLRLTVVIAATLGTAAAVAVSGLIGFVGIIIPHIGAADGRRELPDRAAGLDDRAVRPSWCWPTSSPAPSRRLPRCRSA